jgi:general secretion pathway protein D
VDLMTQPSVVTRSGQNAVIKSVQDFIYPDEYEPPELPNSVGGSSFIDPITGESGSASAPTIVTPATPTSFLTTELGVILEVVPTVSADRRYIEVSLKPQVRDFLGFVNFGTPITGQSSSLGINLANIGNAGANTFTTTSSVGEITPNAILKPLIRNIEANTTVTILDGSTIIIGGQVRETVQKFEDGTPILKDLPFVGRYFRSEGLSTVKTNLMIMVQVELQDPSGKPYRNR